MPCCFGCLMVAFPRFSLFLMWLVGYTAMAFETVLWPLLGFFFLPYTTCAYAVAMNSVGAIHGWGLLLVILGVALDMGTHGGSASSGKRYHQTHIRIER